MRDAATARPATARPVTALPVAPREHAFEQAARQRRVPGLRSHVAQAVPGPLAPVGGTPLDPTDRRDFEQRFGCDFSAVRLHTDRAAADTAAALHARAFTSGSHIGFAAGGWLPGHPRSRALLAHELVHVAQVHAGGPDGTAASMLWRAGEDEPMAEESSSLGELLLTVTTSADEAPSVVLPLYQPDAPARTEALALYVGDILTLRLRAANGRVLSVRSDALPAELERTDLGREQALMLRVLAPGESVTLRVHDGEPGGVSARLELRVGARPAPQGTVDAAWAANEAARTDLKAERKQSREARRDERKALRGAPREERKAARQVRTEQRRDERRRARDLRRERAELVDQSSCNLENQRKIDAAQRRGVQVCDAALAALAAGPNPAATAALTTYLKLESTTGAEGKARVQQVIDVISTARNSLAETRHDQFRCEDCEDETHGASVDQNRRGGPVTICQLWRVGSGLKFDLAPSLEEARAYALVHEFVHLSGITARGKGEEAYVSDTKTWLTLSPEKAARMADAYAAVAWAAGAGKSTP